MKQLVTEFIESLERRDWETWSSLMDSDVVYEVPQTRERIRGRDRYLRFNQEFPGDWHLSLRVAIADEEHGVAWFVWEVDDEEPADAMAFFTFSDGLIVSVTDFWPEPYQPPTGREHLVERW
ncbi:MAG TPA: nuclear transport factor 2 family protein [Acidimicrobiia bacterium]|nr:nuclear transport factor 2 family protein [Acidimicrobiia bacterium]